MKKNLAKYKEEYDPKVHRESTEKKLQSTINSVGEQSALLLMAVRDCIVNKKSQAEIARKYGIPRSRVQQAMSGKRQHKKGDKPVLTGKKKKNMSEEDSIRSRKLRRSEKEQEEKELEKGRLTDQHQSQGATTVKMTVMSCQTSSCKRTSYINFWSFSGLPTILPLGIYLKKLLAITLKSNKTKLKMSLLLTHFFNQVGYELGTKSLTMTIVDGPNP